MYEGARAALEEHADGGMRQHVEAWVVRRSQQAVGLLGRRQLQRLVDRADHKIDAREVDARRRVQAPVLKDFHFGAAEQRESLQALVQHLDRMDPPSETGRIRALQSAIRVEAAGDGQVAQPASDRRVGKRPQPCADRVRIVGACLAGREPRGAIGLRKAHAPA
jgi:hypothetical protein